MKERGTKELDGKLRMDLLPSDALMLVASVLTDGVVKYGDRNWEKGIPYTELAGAIQRHLHRFLLGVDRDKSGHLHLAHLATDALMLLAIYNRFMLECDDRPKFSMCEYRMYPLLYPETNPPEEPYGSPIEASRPKGDEEDSCPKSP